ncbi:TlpA disulfide reductase family protein [Emticicia fontis]
MNCLNLLAQNFYLQGQIKGCDTEWVYLSDYDTNQKIDSTHCKNGAFVFKRHLDEPFMAKLSLESDKNGTLFFVENTNMTLDGSKESLWSSKVNGSALNDLNNYYNENFFHPLRMKFVQNSVERNQLKLPADSLKLKAIDRNTDSLQAVSKQQIVRMIQENSKSFLGLYTLSIHYGEMEIEKVKTLLANLSDELKNTPTGKRLTEIIYKKGLLKAGDSLPVFVLNNTNKQAISSESFIGKYVFYNFWASWCGPCRKEHPELIDLYMHINPQKIEFVSISTDEDLNKWKDAIAKDKLLWKQLVDKVDKNGLTLAENLGIQGIPTNILVDEKGIIVARDITMQEFKSILEKIHK